MDDQGLHNEFDAMEGWEAQYDEARSLPGWAASTREEKQQILSKIIRKSQRRCVPPDDAEALDLCERIVRYYEGPA